MMTTITVLVVLAIFLQSLVTLSLVHKINTLEGKVISTQKDLIDVRIHYFNYWKAKASQVETLDELADKLGVDRQDARHLAENLNLFIKEEDN